MKIRVSFVTFGVILFGFTVSSCDDFVKIDPPRTELVRGTVFENDETAEAAISDIYGLMLLGRFANGTIQGISFTTSLSSDELINYNNSGYTLELKQFNDNVLLSSNSIIAGLWSEPYQYIYKANAIIEGLQSSSGVSKALKEQLEGEAKFIRAFSHFYLVNLFGDVPLVITTDNRTNSVISRAPISLVYQQIISDLLEAKSLLKDDYSYSNNERVRVNKWAASALLARAYLYTQDWTNAEAEATEVINNSDLFSISTDLNAVFQKNSSESIWQIGNKSANTFEAQTFYNTGTPKNAILTPNLVSSFESGDLRFTEWVGFTTDGASTFYFSKKYKAVDLPVIEYSTVLRLSEQYLIRSEARAELDKLSLSIADLDVIRARAGLQPIQIINPSISQSDLLDLIQHERRVELFTEWGHRWMDLKRTDMANSTLEAIKPSWEVTDKLYPIPDAQILNDPGMANEQNPGY